MSKKNKEDNFGYANEFQIGDEKEKKQQDQKSFSSSEPQQIQTKKQSFRQKKQFDTDQYFDLTQNHYYNQIDDGSIFSKNKKEEEEKTEQQSIKKEEKKEQQSIEEQEKKESSAELIQEEVKEEEEEEKSPYPSVKTKNFRKSIINYSIKWVKKLKNDTIDPILEQLQSNLNTYDYINFEIMKDFWIQNKNNTLEQNQRNELFRKLCLVYFQTEAKQDIENGRVKNKELCKEYLTKMIEYAQNPNSLGNSN